MSIVRKFKAPQGKPVPSVPGPGVRPGTDCDIPEINTDFMDNLYQDPAFMDRFDASYQPTAPIGIAVEVPGHPAIPAEDVNMLEIEFPVTPKT